MKWIFWCSITRDVLMKQMFQLGVLVLLVLFPGLVFAAESTKTTTFLDTVFAPGFHWQIRPDDLGGAKKTQRNHVDPSINKWEYVYDGSARYVFTDGFSQLFDADDKIDVEFSFIKDSFNSVHVLIRTSNVEEVEMCKAYFVKALGQSEIERTSLVWKKDKYVLKYFYSPPSTYRNRGEILISIYPLPTAEEQKKTEEANRRLSQYFKQHLQ